MQWSFILPLPSRKAEIIPYVGMLHTLKLKIFILSWKAYNPKIFSLKELIVFYLLKKQAAVVTTWFSVYKNTGLTVENIENFKENVNLFLPSFPTSLWDLPVCFMLPCHGPILFTNLFCALDSTYEWYHVILVFLWLANFT